MCAMMWQRSSSMSSYLHTHTASSLSSSCLSILFFFFFQAEDGIRDPLVTGVQTCALPIWLLADPTGEAHIFDVVDHIANVTEAHGHAIFVGNDQITIFGGRGDLVVGANGVGLSRAVEASFGRVDIILQESGADIFEADAERSERGRVHLDADSRLLIAFDGDEADTSDFAEFLSEDSVGKV